MTELNYLVDNNLFDAKLNSAVRKMQVAQPFGNNPMVLDSEYLFSNPNATKLLRHLKEQSVKTNQISVIFENVFLRKLQNIPRKFVFVRQVQEKSPEGSLLDFQIILSRFFGTDEKGVSDFTSFFKGSYNQEILGFTHNAFFKGIHVNGYQRRNGIQLLKITLIQKSAFKNHDIKVIYYIAGFQLFDVLKELKEQLTPAKVGEINALKFIQNSWS